MRFPGEQQDIALVVEIGRKWGFGNLIQSLKDAWSESLQQQGIERQAADMAARHICVWCKTDTRTGKKVEP